MKPMGPATDTVTAQMPVAATNRSARVRVMLTPRERAERSSCARSGSSRAHHRPSTTKGANPTSSGTMTSIRTKPVVPASHSWDCAARRSSAARKRYATSAWNSRESAIPTMTMRLLVPIPPSATSRMAASTAPNSASPARHQNMESPSASSGREKTVPRTTMTDAPPVTPRMSGEASGLRDIDCVHDPASPSAAPTMRVASATGMRRSQTTRISLRLPPPLRISRTRPGLKSTGP